MDIANVIHKSFGENFQIKAVENNRAWGVIVKPVARIGDVVCEIFNALSSLGQFVCIAKTRGEKLQDTGTHIALAAIFVMDIVASIFINLINPKIYTAVPDAVRAECATEIDTLNTSLTEASDNNIRLQAELTRERSAAKQLTDKHQEYKQSTDAQIKNIVPLQEQIAELTESNKKIQKLESNLATAQGRLEKQIEEKNTLEQQIAQLQEENTTVVEAKSKKLQEMTDGLEAKSKKLQEMTDGLEDKYIQKFQDLNKKITLLKSQNKFLNDETTSLKDPGKNVGSKISLFDRTPESSPASKSQSSQASSSEPITANVCKNLSDMFNQVATPTTPTLSKLGKVKARIQPHESPF